ncbi:hypothetical protein D6833_13415 [Candidatus Parcubacteria bacterium]|nr:MAG: hypothetical protein D6833_13415 [Candidatus Parcubacteria bacterium]
MKYFQPHRKYIRLGNGHEYVFTVRANISLTWVEPEDVQRILNIRRACCGGKRNQQFFLANESDVRRWTNNGGR